MDPRDHLRHIHFEDLRHVHFEGVEARPRVRAPHAPDSAAREAAREAALVPIDPFVVWLFERFGLDAAAYDPRSLRRRLPACLRALAVETPAAGRARLEDDPTRLPAALRAMLVGVSGFFRDKTVFRGLGEQVLPALGAPRSGLRVCALGASEGQELYSVAMLLADAGRLDGSDLLGVDVRPDAIAFASAGSYSTEQLAGLSPEILDRHFVPTATGACLRSAVRARTRWLAGTIFAPPEDGPWDLVLFRNVGIYLSVAAHGRAWAAIRERLAPGGVVVTGTAERPPASTGLKPVAPCAYAESG
jgi:chemotaxis methyl-accepting protein methylase